MKITILSVTSIDYLDTGANIKVTSLNEVRVAFIKSERRIKGTSGFCLPGYPSTVLFSKKYINFIMVKNERD